jgi:hypothetical protein
VEARPDQRYRSAGHPFDLLDKPERLLTKLLEPARIHVLLVDIVGERECDVGWRVERARFAKQRPVELSDAAELPANGGVLVRF